MGKTVILIGNGFDMSLGVETSYMHFINSIFFKHLNENSLCKKIEAQSSIQNWVDLELEILAYAKELSKIFNPSDVSIFKNEYEELSQALTEYLNAKANYSCDLPPLIDNLTSIWYNEYKRDNDSEKPTVICFNYTPHCNLHFSHWCDVKYVHGKISTNKIVLGADDISHKDINPAFSFILKSGADDLNILNIGDIIYNAEKYIIFGCSLGYSDYWYYNRIFNANKKIFEIYHHGSDQKELILNNIRTFAGNLSDFRSNNILNLFDSSNLEQSRIRYHNAMNTR